jgi:hypothetical protein
VSAFFVHFPIAFRPKFFLAAFNSTFEQKFTRVSSRHVLPQLLLLVKSFLTNLALKIPLNFSMNESNVCWKRVTTSEEFATNFASHSQVRVLGHVEFHSILHHPMLTDGALIAFDGCRRVTGSDVGGEVRGGDEIVANWTRQTFWTLAIVFGGEVLAKLMKIPVGGAMADVTLEGSVWIVLVSEHVIVEGT